MDLAREGVEADPGDGAAEQARGRSQRWRRLRRRRGVAGHPRRRGLPVRGKGERRRDREREKDQRGKGRRELCHGGAVAHLGSDEEDAGSRGPRAPWEQRRLGKVGATAPARELGMLAPRPPVGLRVENKGRRCGWLLHGPTRKKYSWGSGGGAGLDRHRKQRRWVSTDLGDVMGSSGGGGMDP